MVEVISIRFKSRGKIYYFDPQGTDVMTGEFVVVETSKGLELGECVQGNHHVPKEKLVLPLRPLIRIATQGDLKVAKMNKDREAEAFQVCQEKIEAHKLDMKLVDVEFNFEGNKVMFFFTSDGRVDFRELVKDLASVFRTRIELRQIGVRDEAKMLGGIGICGRAFCCNQFLDDFQPVSTKMAKTQSMSLNPTKISGACGRLMCCLRYEQDAYEDLIAHTPKSGTVIDTPAGPGYVTQVHLLRQKVKVKIQNAGDDALQTFHVNELSGGKDPAQYEDEEKDALTDTPEVLRSAPRKSQEKQYKTISQDRAASTPSNAPSPMKAEQRSDRGENQKYPKSTRRPKRPFIKKDGKETVEHTKEYTNEKKPVAAEKKSTGAGGHRNHYTRKPTRNVNPKEQKETHVAPTRGAPEGEKPKSVFKRRPRKRNGKNKQGPPAKED